jgi:hypothetical protein
MIGNIFKFLPLNVGKIEVINNCLNFGRIMTKIVMNWPKRKNFLRRLTEHISR